MESFQQAQVKDSATLCSIAALPDGSLRVVLDDVCRGCDPGTWQHRSLFTFRDYGPGTLENLAAFSEQELAQFGYNLLARLLASNGYGA